MAAPNHFDRGKPFYPLIVNYVGQLIGFKELAVRGLVGPRSIEDAMASFTASHAPAITYPEQARRMISELLGPLRMPTTGEQAPIVVDIDDITKELVNDREYLSETMLNAAGSILILAHEVSKEEAWHDAGPLWEFLRHCRNAAAHGGRFHFRNAEPRRPATWGRLTLEDALQGTPLFRRPTRNGLLTLGDPIRLLWDIEQAFPTMVVR